MQTEDFILKESGYWEVLEEIRKHFPHTLGSILFHALIIEAVKLIYLAILMVSSQKSYPIPEFDL